MVSLHVMHASRVPIDAPPTLAHCVQTQTQALGRTRRLKPTSVQCGRTSGYAAARRQGSGGPSER